MTWRDRWRDPWRERAVENALHEHFPLYANGQMMEWCKAIVYGGRQHKESPLQFVHSLCCFLILFLWTVYSPVVGRSTPLLADAAMKLHTHGKISSQSDETEHSHQLEATETFALYIQGLETGDVRRILLGPGSSPPNCISKCGKCTPCKPVRVPIQPGNSAGLMEYYPEAWRCKCKNKLFMP